MTIIKTRYSTGRLSTQHGEVNFDVRVSFPDNQQGAIDGDTALSFGIDAVQAALALDMEPETADSNEDVEPTDV